jgi:hypothetical protein
MKQIHMFLCNYLFNIKNEKQKYYVCAGGRGEIPLLLIFVVARSQPLGEESRAKIHYRQNYKSLKQI